jgi:DNA-binding NarL/FixJ family response regulator
MRISHRVFSRRATCGGVLPETLPQVLTSTTRARCGEIRYVGSPQVRLVVVDDHVVFREGVRALIARIAGIEVVGEASSTDEAVEVAAQCRPDVILMDLHLPGDGGTAATERILETQPDVAVLVLTMHTDDAHLRQAIAAGARGYLLKDADPDAIVRAIIAVREGQLIFDPGIADMVLASASAAQEARPFPSLTEREREVLDRIARGLRNEAIAARMGISVKTVQNSVSAILLKLGAADRAQLVALARDAGLGARG